MRGSIAKTLLAALLLAAPLAAQDALCPYDPVQTGGASYRVLVNGVLGDQAYQRLDIAVRAAAAAETANPRDTVAVVHDLVLRVECPLTWSLPTAPPDTVITPPDTTTTPPPPPPPPASGTVVFSSDWDTPGANYTDGGNWAGESMWISEARLPVRDGRLVIRPDGADQAWLPLRAQGVPQPAIGETIVWTWRMTVTDEGSRVADRLTHGIGWGSFTVPGGFALLYVYTRPGQWRIEFYTDGRPFAGARDPSGEWDRPLIAGQMYDFTVGLERVGNATIRPTIEIRDTSGNLIASTPDFWDYPLRGSANAVRLSDQVVPGTAQEAAEFLGFLNGLADQPAGFVEWAEIDFVRAEIR